VRRVILFFLGLILLVTINGCASISKETFVSDVSRLSQKGQLSAPTILPQSKNYDVNKKNNILYNKIFSEPIIASAIYDEAVKQRKAWSLNSIVTSNWGATLRNNGFSNLPDSDKIKLLKLMSKAFFSATQIECSALKNNAINLYSMFEEREVDEFMEIQYNILYYGALAKQKDFKRSKKEFFVALLVLANKLKDGFTDDELGDMLYALLEKQKTPADIDCKVISKVIDMTIQFEPKYRTFLFNGADFK